MSIVPLIVPLFGLAMLGWGIAKTGWPLSVGWQKGVNELTARILVPMLLFTGMYQHGLPKQHAWGILLSFYIALVGLFLLLFVLQRGSRDRASIALAGSFSNLVYVGMPVVNNLFGSQGLAYLFPIVAFHSLVLFALYYSADAWGRADQGPLRQSVFKSLKTPIVLSLMAGLGANLVHLPLPNILLDTLHMGARAALPCALIVMGASLAGISFQQVKWRMLLILVAKLLLLPGLVLITSHFIFAMPILMTRVLVVMASCPVGINAYVVVRSNGGNAQTVSSAIVMSSWLSLLAWPFWLWVVQSLPLTH
ncbi:AEC family transporter [Celerinatantimonas yamalensis]|uniref:AEC family transporter n=1 Tax=Celerinatantimonas yamalensis TaxID=559956 RepID=A0ABW9GA53_9GAMM